MTPAELLVAHPLAPPLGAQQRDGHELARETREEKRSRFLVEMTALGEGGEARRLNLEMGGRMTHQRVQWLKEQGNRDRQRVHEQLVSEQQAAALRGDNTFYERLGEAHQDEMKAAATGAFASERSKGEMARMQEGWEALEMITQSESVRGVLEFWEDQEEVRASLVASEESREERKTAALRKRNELHDELTLSRDAGFGLRVAYDARVDEVNKALAKTDRSLRTAQRRYKDIEHLVRSATGSLNRLAAVFLHPMLIERSASKRALVRHSKQLRDVERALQLMPGGMSRSNSERSVAPLTAAAAEEGGDGLSADEMDDPETLLSNLPNNVLSLLGLEADGEGKGSGGPDAKGAEGPKGGAEGGKGGAEGPKSVSLSDLRAAQARLLCAVSEFASRAVADALEAEGKPLPTDGAPIEIKVAPQLESVEAQQLNIRLSAVALLPRLAVAEEDIGHEGERLGRWSRHAGDEGIYMSESERDELDASARRRKRAMELEVAAQGIGGAREGKRVWLDSIVAAPGPAVEPINARDTEEARVALEAYLTDKERIKRREIKLLIDKGRTEEAGMRKRALSPKLSPKQPPHTKPSSSSPRSAATAPTHVAAPAAG